MHGVHRITATPMAILEFKITIDIFQMTTLLYEPKENLRLGKLKKAINPKGTLWNRRNPKKQLETLNFLRKPKEPKGKLKP